MRKYLCLSKLQSVISCKNADVHGKIPYIHDKLNSVFYVKQY